MSQPGSGWKELHAEEILRRLTGAHVDFVVIGGMAAVLLGSARLTKDLDIVYATDRENLGRLGAVLVDLDATLREVDEDLPFVPDERTLRGVSLLTLDTSLGWLDILSEPGGAPAYDELKAGAVRFELGSFSVLVASPDDMIAMKRASGRPQDLADIAELEALKRLRAERGGA